MPNNTWPQQAIFRDEKYDQNIAASRTKRTGKLNQFWKFLADPEIEKTSYRG